MGNISRVTFKRLSSVPLEILLSHMNDARVSEHLPLLTSQWSVEDARQFIETKEAHWVKDGLGHWAIFVDGQYAGWGGFQKEDSEWDFGLVLTPEAFGSGLIITQDAIKFAQQNTDIPYITFLLPLSRQHLRALKKLGAEFVGEVSYQDTLFKKFRLNISAQ